MAPGTLAASTNTSDNGLVALRWVEQSLTHAWAASRLAFRIPGIHSIALDAAQLGKPFIDFVVIHQANLPENLSITMAPKDTSHG